MGSVWSVRCVIWHGGLHLTAVLSTVEAANPRVDGEDNIFTVDIYLLRLIDFVILVF